MANSIFSDSWFSFQIDLTMEAWVTLVTNDNYAVGALTLAASLKRVNSTKKVAIMITNTVSDNIKNTLGEVFDDVIGVDAMDSGDIANLTLLDRTELGITFTKVILNYLQSCKVGGVSWHPHGLIRGFKIWTLASSLKLSLEQVSEKSLFSLELYIF